MMQFCVLGSGSGGNATIVKAGETVLLVDAGFSAARLRDKMKVRRPWNRRSWTSILLTHEHTDHMKGVHQFTQEIHRARLCHPPYGHVRSGKGAGSPLGLL